LLLTCFHPDVVQEVNFTVLDSSTQTNNGRGLLQAVEGLLSSVYIPALRQLEKGWEQLYTQDGQGIRNSFLNSLDSFVTVLAGQLFSQDFSL
jgi:dynein heavy chain